VEWPISSVEEPLAEGDGELCLCLELFPGRPPPLLGRVVKNEIEQLHRGFVTREMPAGTHRSRSLLVM